MTTIRECINIITLGDMPEFYDKMPYNEVEKFWKYLILLYTKGFLTSDISKEDIKIVSGHLSRFSNIFDVFKQFLFLAKDLKPEEKKKFEKYFSEGIEIVTKSVFQFVPGEVKLEKISYLEHYLMMCKEDPNIISASLVKLLVEKTPGGLDILKQYQKKSYQFLALSHDNIC